MRKNLTKLLTTSLLTSVFIFAGCGGTQATNGITTNQAHQVTIKEPRAGENLPDVDIWQEFVDISSVYDKNNQEMLINVHCNKGISPDVFTYQVYIDSDENNQTGFSAGESSWAINGADYLIDDDALFRSTSDTNWEWEWIGDISVYKSGSKTDDYNIEYTLISDNIQDIFGANIPDKINVSVEPVDENWQDTNNYVPIQNLIINESLPG